MKRIIYTVFTVAFFLSALSSCKKFLDKTPINQATDDNFWQNESEANNGIAGAYSLLRTALNEMGFAYYYYGDFPTDQFNVPPTGEDYQQINRIEWNFFVAPTELHRAMIRLRRWDNFYRAVDQANRCIKFISEIPEANFAGSNKQQAKDALLGEAYFLRAFNYFYMARVWGDVPLTTETVEDAAEAPHLPRTPQNEVLDQCIKDLEVAIPKMAWKPYSTSRATRVGRGAAYALLAHIHAWKGDYAKVIPAADSVILKGNFTYVDRSNQATYLSMFKGNSTEGIFEIAQNANNEGAGSPNLAYGGIINNVAFRTLKAPYLATNLGNSHFPLDRITLSTLFPDDLDSNDYRRKNGFAFWGTTDPITIKYSNILYTGANNTSPLSLNNIIIFRLAGIKLLRAEAAAATGAFADARTTLNEIRNLAFPAGLKRPFTGPDDKLFEAVIDERGRELFLEGHRFYDLVRLARKTNIIKFNGSQPITRMDQSQFQQGKYFWPVDPVLIQVNPGLTQTPYWSDKM
jgi:hypothetical protein